LKILKSVIAVIVAGALFAAAYIYFTGAESPSISKTQENSVVINEYMAANRSFLPDDNGQYSDWVEIYNPLETSAALSGYGLSNDKKSVKWTFPGITLEPGGYIVVFASGAGTTDPAALFQHAGFKLSAEKGGVYLFDREGRIIDSEEYNAVQTPDVSVGRDASNPNSWKQFTKPTPGFINDESGYEAFQKSRIAKDPQLLITEVMASNKTAVADNKGKYSDYIEIYNKGGEAVDLAGYGLSDDPAKALKWKFPAVTIGPGEYIVVFASGEDDKATDVSKGALHTNFRLSAYRQSVLLCDKMGYILDRIDISEMASDTAYSRILSAGAYTGEWEKTDKPTPGFPNDAKGYSDFINGRSKQ